MNEHKVEVRETNSNNPYEVLVHTILRQEKPIFLFVGPTGAGKSWLVKELRRNLTAYYPEIANDDFDYDNCATGILEQLMDSPPPDRLLLIDAYAGENLITVENRANLFIVNVTADEDTRYTNILNRGTKDETKIWKMIRSSKGIYEGSDLTIDQSISSRASSEEIETLFRH